MKKIRVETRTEKLRKGDELRLTKMHYVYLIEGGSKTFLCKQRWYHGVDRFFHRDLPVDAIRRHKWGRDRMVDNLMTRLPRCLAEAERWSGDWAA